MKIPIKYWTAKKSLWNWNPKNLFAARAKWKLKSIQNRCKIWARIGKANSSANLIFISRTIWTARYAFISQLATLHIGYLADGVNLHSAHEQILLLIVKHHPPYLASRQVLVSRAAESIRSNYRLSDIHDWLAEPFSREILSARVKLPCQLLRPPDIETSC